MRLPKHLQSPVAMRPLPLAIALACASMAGLATPANAQSPVPGSSFLPGTVVGSQVWQGATVPGFQPGSQTLEILQTQSRASLYWNRFNIDVGQTVRFNQQGNRDWVALNWIADQNPTHIAGRLVADGQIYLINQNGIVFKPGAQVDASSFIASTLQINSEAFLRSLVALRDGRAAFTAFPGATTGRIELQQGTITNLAGAVIPGPNGQPLTGVATITSAEGGRVFLLAAQEVVNNGRIQSNGGQVVLAAGTSVFLFAPATTDDASFRGLYVEVNSGGSSRNLGEILTERGNTSLVGLAVNNSGRISADSSIGGNGSVWLLARSDLPGSFNANTGVPKAARTGEVTLGASSVIELQPRDTVVNAQSQTLLDSQIAFPGQVRIEGRAIHLQGSASGGARIVAPSGDVFLRAIENPQNTPGASELASQPSQLTEANGPTRILIDANASIDVSGLRGVSIPVSRNLLEVTLLGDAVADAPLIRNSPISGSTVTIDVRTGTPLLSQSALNAQIASGVRRSFLERSTTGGKVRLYSEGDTILQSGSTIGIAGGSIDYTPGRLTTSRLFDGSRLFDIGSAPADRTYLAADSLATTDPRWGVTTITDLRGPGRFDPGYSEGKSGGWLDINSRWISLNSGLSGQTITGFYQRQLPPDPARLSLGNRDSYGAPSIAQLPDFRVVQPILFDDSVSAPLPTLTLTDPRQLLFGNTLDAPIRLSPVDLAAGGIGRVEALTNAQISLPSTQSLNLPASGRLTLGGSNVNIEGRINVPAARRGSVNEITTSDGIEIAAFAGGVRLGPNASVVADGQWSIETGITQAGGGFNSAIRDAGSIRLRSLASLDLSSGSTISSSAGATLSATGAVTGGNGGSISLQLLDPGQLATAAIGTLNFGATLTGFGFGSGAAFVLSVPSLAIDASGSSVASAVLQPSFFSNAGFSSFDLTGTESARIVAGTSVSLQQRNYITQGSSSTTRSVIRTGDDLRASVGIGTLDDRIRRSTNLTVRAPSRFRGSLEIDPGTTIQTDPGASVRLEAGTSLSANGTISAPGGAITANLGATTSYNGYRPGQNLYLGASAHWDVSGVAVGTNTLRGRLISQVFDGGSIELNANEGHILTDPASRLLARGITGLFDYSPNPRSTNPAIDSRLISSNGGRIALNSLSGGLIAGSVDVSAGTANARAGDLTLRGNAPRIVEASPIPLGAGAPPTAEQNIVVRSVAQSEFLSGVQTQAAQPNTLAVDPSVISSGSIGRLRMDTADAVRFSDPLQVSAQRSIELDARTLQLANGSSVDLAAPSVVLGSTRQGINFGAPAPSPTAGAGSLSVRGTSAIDLLGSLTIQGASNTVVTSQGPIRFQGVFGLNNTTAGAKFEGSLQYAGNLSLTGSQLYPNSYSDFSITGVGVNSSLVIGPGNSSAAFPLSAAGSLSLAASDIDISGVVIAPFGAINASATNQLRVRDGALVSVAGVDSQGRELLVPFGTTQDLRSTIYAPVSGQSNFVTSLPKLINLSGGSVEVAPGATVDARGGGDIQAYSFVARGGVGNSGDILARSNVFALVPGQQSVAPIDPEAQRSMLEARGEVISSVVPSTFRGAIPTTVPLGSTRSLRVGDQVQLAQSNDLPGGTYTLLPARYALLPGAFAVVVTTGQTEATSAVRLADGSALVPGRLVTQGTPENPSFAQLFNVMPQAVVRQYSDYIFDSGNRSFSTAAQAAGTTAPRLPRDGGQVSLDVSGTNLDLSGLISLQGSTLAGVTSRSGEFALSASSLYVGGPSGAAPSNSVVVDSSRLAAIDAESIVLGGRSTVNSSTQASEIQALASSVVVGANVILGNRSVVLTGTNSVTLEPGARIGAGNTIQGTAADVALRGPGAFVASSENINTRYSSTGSAGGTSTLSLGAGAAVSGGSVALVGPGGIASNGGLNVNAPSLLLGSNTLILGSGNTSSTGTRITTSDLSSLNNAQRLQLDVTSSLVLTDNVLLGGTGMQTLVVNTPNIDGQNSGNSTFSAQSVFLTNTSPTLAAAPVNGSASLLIKATTSIANGAPVSGSGRINIAAPSQNWTGFAVTELNTASSSGAAGEIRATANSSIRSAGNLLMRSGRLVVDSGRTINFDTSGTVQTSTEAGSVSHHSAPGLGGKFGITASAITFDSLASLPSGLFSLTAQNGNLTLGSTADIDLRGISVPIASSGAVDTPGGQAVMRATAGSITTLSGSTIRVGANGNEAAGSIRHTASGNLTLNGAATAGASANPSNAGEFSATAATIANPTQLLTDITNSGFQRSVTLTQTAGNLNIGTIPTPGSQNSVVRANQISLSADSGSVGLQGTSLVTPSDSQVIPGVESRGGQVSLNAAQNIVLGPGTSVAADSAAGPGVSVLLNASAGVSLAGSAAAPVNLDLRGRAGGKDGSLELRIPRALAPSSINVVNAAVIGGSVTVTSVDTFTGITEVRNSGASTGTVLALGATGGALQRANALMTSAAGSGGHTASALLAAIAPLSAAALVRPEIDIVGVDLSVNQAPSSTVGNITVSENLDFSAVRYSGQAGVLTIRAPRDLVLAGTAPGGIVGPEAVINDGFTTGSGVTRTTASNSPFNSTTPNSWSYNLVAGANPNAASPLTTRDSDSRLSAGGDLRLLNNRQIRTGTGDINLRAAGTIAIGTSNATSNTVATTGAASVLTYGRTDTASIGPFVLPSTAGLQTAQQIDLNPRYTVDGGDISAVAGRSIQSVESGNLVSSWLFRWGQINASTDTFVNNRQVSWWARPDLFRQSFGALGGGNISLTAAQDITGVSASIASTGRLTGTNPSTGVLVETGGGHLDVKAGTAASVGSIISGSFNNMRGTINLQAADSFGTNRTLVGAAVYPLIGIGDTSVTATARTDAIVDQIYNPTLAPGRTGATGTTARGINNFAQINQLSTFSTYTDRSAARVLSIGGDVAVVSTEPSLLFTGAGLLDPNSQYQGRELPFKAYPGQLAFLSASGNVDLSNSRLATAPGAVVSGSQLFTIPVSNGGIVIQGAQDVSGDARIYQGDFDLTTAFGVRTPSRSNVGVADWAAQFNPDLDSITRANTPTRRGDAQPSIVIAGRDLATRSSRGNQLQFEFAEQARLEAGRDFSDVVFEGQNVNSTDLTSITAGRDVVNRVTYSPLNQLGTNFAGITINGPGELVIRSGRDIAMGSSQGIRSRGNVSNPALSTSGASLTLVAGLADDADYQALLRTYVDPTLATPARPVSYDQMLVDFVAKELGSSTPAGMTPTQAWTLFSAFPAHRQNALARNVFFAEVRAGGVGFGDQTSVDFGTAGRAYAAAQILFPKDGAGNIDLIFSQVKSEQGGKIEVLTPGTVCRTAPASCDPKQFNAAVGNVFAGLTSPPPELTTLKTPSDLGFLTLNGGDMNFYTGRDIAINQSRALTAGGGSITMFSALGNIDAGRGSRSAVSAPPPQVRVDANGNIVVELPGAVQGSGIGVLVTRSDVPIGDVFLFAPKGFLDAGEAGVRSSGNVVVAAVEVRNAANISFGGTGSGVPVSTPSVNIGGLSAASTGSTGSQAAASAAQSSTENAGARNQRRTLLVLEFLGFGEEGEEAYRRRRGR